MEGVEIENIWYGKKSDEVELVKYPHEEKRGGSRGFICIHYARNKCTNAGCQFIHRTPIDSDVFPPTMDCFGRERFADYRDDFSGVGQLNSVNKTIWISPLKLREMDLYRVMVRFGDVESVRVIREMGFVCFKLEATAQFTREVLDNRKFDLDSDQMRVRWAKDHQESGDVDLKKLAIDLLNKLQRKKRRRSLQEEEEEPTVASESLISLSSIPQKKDSLQVLAGYSSDSS